MKIVFMGTPDYATVIFQKLLENNYEVVALFTQPDKKVGRKQIVTAPHIKQFCLDKGLSLPIYQPKTLKDISVENIIKNLEPDFIIVAAYGQILPKNILDIAPCINLHASLLPKYRGASPIQQAILNDDKFTGVTSMLMEQGLDSGDILGLEYVKITPNMDVEELFEKLSNSAAKLTLKTLENYKYIKPKKQNLSQVSYCKKIKKSDGEIKFDDGYKIYQKFKAYKFWPGIFLNSGLKIKECELYKITSNSSNKAGEIINISKDYIVVACEIGCIKITFVQPPSKKSMNAVDYIHGARLKVGNILT
jgi:methionyl-tRNA formyltransferase